MVQQLRLFTALKEDPGSVPRTISIPSIYDQQCTAIISPAPGDPWDLLASLGTVHACACAHAHTHTHSQNTKAAGQWWRMFLIPALGDRDRWISEFEASLVYRESSRRARATRRNAVSKTKPTKQKFTKPNDDKYKHLALYK